MRFVSNEKIIRCFEMTFWDGFQRFKKSTWLLKVATAPPQKSIWQIDNLSRHKTNCKITPFNLKCNQTCHWDPVSMLQQPFA